MAPKDRSISPTTMTSVSPIAMIATELMARSTETPKIGVGEIGIDDDEHQRDRIDARNSPPMRKRKRRSVALPAAEMAGHGSAPPWLSGDDRRWSSSILVAPDGKPMPAGRRREPPSGRSLELIADLGLVEFLARARPRRPCHGLQRLRVGQDRRRSSGTARRRGRRKPPGPASAGRAGATWMPFSIAVELALGRRSSRS